MVETWTEVTEQTEAWVSETREGTGAFAAGHFDADAFDVATIWDPWVAAGGDIELWTATIDIELSGGAPVILSVSPESGPSGTLLTITGQNFTSVTSVTIDGLEASFTIVDDSTILATVP